ncbi:unnamed protein product, partial [Amoebophrya sp. A25]|eukprot:GSA25T00003951001.1
MLLGRKVGNNCNKSPTFHVRHIQPRDIEANLDRAAAMRTLASFRLESSMEWELLDVQPRKFEAYTRKAQLRRVVHIEKRFCEKQKAGQRHTEKEKRAALAQAVESAHRLYERAKRQAKGLPEGKT